MGKIQVTAVIRFTFTNDLIITVQLLQPLITDYNFNFLGVAHVAQAKFAKDETLVMRLKKSQATHLNMSSMSLDVSMKFNEQLYGIHMI